MQTIFKFSICFIVKFRFFLIRHHKTCWGLFGPKIDVLVINNFWISDFFPEIQTILRDSFNFIGFFWLIDGKVINLNSFFVDMEKGFITENHVLCLQLRSNNIQHISLFHCNYLEPIVEQECIFRVVVDFYPLSKSFIKLIDENWGMQF